VLVPWRDAGAIASAVTGLLMDDDRRASLRHRAAAHGRSMHWPAVADQYLASFARAVREHAADAHATFQTQTLASRLRGLPDINVRHLRMLTDDTGLLQHANFCIPRYSEGYCLDDNARALLLMARLEEAGTDPGRTSLASQLFHAALPVVRDFTSPRAWATTLLGIEEYLRAFDGDRRVQEFRALLADRLQDLYRGIATPAWPWFEDRLTYANAQLPHALIVAGARMQRADLLTTGIDALAWLGSVQRASDGYFAPIGTNGFSVKEAEPARFDQQPIEAATMVAACLDAARVTDTPGWNEQARQAFDWFLGQNHLRQWLHDPSTGGCRDGLHADRVNENQGAESTLAFLLALIDMRTLDRLDVSVLLPRS